MSSLLLEFYRELPQPRPEDDPDLLQAGLLVAARRFRELVAERYTEGTLQRLLASDSVESRRAAALALGMLGTFRGSNAALASALRDADSLVRRHAADGLWDVWFRGNAPDHERRLREAIAHPDSGRVLANLTALIAAEPEFAEAYNQRAIVHFRRGESTLAIPDCDEVLRLNPAHYGAAAGLGQCLLRSNKPRAALRAFRQALAIYPDLASVVATVRDLETALGDDPRNAE